MYYEAYEAIYTQYRPVCQTKMSASVHYVPFRQTYCSSNIPHIQYIREFLLHFIAYVSYYVANSLSVLMTFPESTNNWDTHIHAWTCTHMHT